MPPKAANVGYKPYNNITTDAHPPYLLPDNVPDSNSVWTLICLRNMVEFLTAQPVEAVAGKKAPVAGKKAPVAGDAHRYKPPVIKKLVVYLNERVIYGGSKKVQGVKGKITECLGIYRAVLYLKERSGGSWSDELGANIINGVDDDSWNDICLQRPACAPFRNKGWIPFNWFESLDPAKAKGDSVYRPGISRALLPSNLSQNAPNASQHAPNTSQNMYNTSSNTTNGWGGNFTGSPQGPMLSLPDFGARSFARAGSPEWDYQEMDDEFGAPPLPSNSNLFDLLKEGFSLAWGVFDTPQDDYSMDGIDMDPDSSLTSTLRSSSPIPPALVPSTPVTSSTTRSTIPATSKKAKTSKLNAADAANNLGAALTTFGNQFEKSTSGFTDAVRVSNDQASPVRRRNAIDLVDKEDWLTLEQQMALGDVVKMTDNADTYLNWASKGEEKRKAWVTHELTKAGKM
ncbi:hypothetical protein C8F01DRAFT_1058415 [Mycena amicta]|nr:hypothetical protein C8F01DRAFT_1058415 [Mycena amicta]